MLNVKYLLMGTFLCGSSMLHASDIKIEEIKKITDSEKSTYLETLKNLVNIESGSKDLDGLDKISKYIAEQFKEIGADVSIIPSNDIYKMDDTPDRVGPVVKAVFKGKGRSNIMMIAHMDTVYSRGMLKQQPFKIEGNKVYGLGILDDKQGIATILHTIKSLKSLNYNDYGTITVMINSDEEISSPGARKLITEEARNKDLVLSFEGGGVKDTLRLATSGIAAAYLTVEGKSSHAGVKPEAGVNALTELSHQILQLQNLSNAETGLKVNWTIATAGKTRNVIPDMATAQADIRALRLDDFKTVEKTLHEKIQNKKLADSNVSVKFEIRRPPLMMNEKSQELALKAQSIYQNELNLPMNVASIATGGGTDAAFAGVESKAAIIEGMGLTGDGAHSSRAEYINLDSISPRLYLAARLIMEVSAK